MEIRNEMQDFMIHVPTQIFFGRSAIDHLAESIEKWSPKKRVLLVYGGGSIKRGIRKVEKSDCLEEPV